MKDKTALIGTGSTIAQSSRQYPLALDSEVKKAYLLDLLSSYDYAEQQKEEAIELAHQIAKGSVYSLFNAYSIVGRIYQHLDLWELVNKKDISLDEKVDLFFLALEYKRRFPRHYRISARELELLAAPPDDNSRRARRQRQTTKFSHRIKAKI